MRVLAEVAAEELADLGSGDDCGAALDLATVAGCGVRKSNGFFPVFLGEGTADVAVWFLFCLGDGDAHLVLASGTFHRLAS